MNLNASEAKARRLFNRFDVDGSGEMEYEEFRNAWLLCCNIKQELASLNRGFADGVRNHFGVFGEARRRRIAHARAKCVDLVVLTRPPLCPRRTV